ncbi:hypothetical protein MBAV_003564 [Candidatus Magnetobacterium bavaricum]|uniref:Uncharacterized protein n=1 Tax=Candidatus Magnetobacterium bavaricum TaxID=29290 RepID=A0A0F3GU50_9BACT|nr:hypothetical protein MBAV_003564 [Candidatus Magnetobacterium bavaricum]
MGASPPTPYKEGVLWPGWVRLTAGKSCPLSMYKILTILLLFMKVSFFWFYNVEQIYCGMKLPWLFK